MFYAFSVLFEEHGFELKSYQLVKLWNKIFLFNQFSIWWCLLLYFKTYTRFKLSSRTWMQKWLLVSEFEILSLATINQIWVWLTQPKISGSEFSTQVWIRISEPEPLSLGKMYSVLSSLFSTKILKFRNVYSNSERLTNVPKFAQTWFDYDLKWPLLSLISNQVPPRVPLTSFSSRPPWTVTTYNIFVS